MHLCDQRRDTAAIRSDFGERVNVDGLPPTDELWSEQREPKDGVADRSARFIRWLMQRPEQDIAVTTHHHVLLVLFNCVLQSDDPNLRKPFEVGEMRSIRLSCDVRGEDDRE